MQIYVTYAPLFIFFESVAPVGLQLIGLLCCRTTVNDSNNKYSVMYMKLRGGGGGGGCSLS